MNNLKEQELFKLGYQYIAGLDEVGRGCIAGPVVATCVIMPKDCYIEGVRDSKKLTDKARRELKNIIEANALAISTSFVSEKIIDQTNILQATKIAMVNCVDKIEIKPDYLLIDALKIDVNIPSEAVIHGDDLIFTIACASIIAKVTRDDYMISQSYLYPGYKLHNNKGYPTKYHKEALNNLGILPIHRLTYSPVSDVINNNILHTKS